MGLSPSRRLAFHYSGKIGELYRIFLLNILFTILTLGIYRFWAITRYRRYFWSRMAFQGQGFVYTGTGGQLFLGFLLAGLALLGMVVVAAGLAYLLPSQLAFIPIAAVYLAILVLAAGAVFSAQRYRLSRTVWRGIQGGMEGSAAAYGGRAILYVLLTVVTLFQMAPWSQLRLAERRINASRFGNTAFRFTGRARSIYLPFLLTFVAALALVGVAAGLSFRLVLYVAPELMSGRPVADPQQMLMLFQRLVWVAAAEFVLFGIVVALIGAWYRCVLVRHILGRTSLGAMRFASSMAPGALLGLILGNVLLLVFTLGLGLPLVLHRNARFLADTLWVDREVDPAQLGQSSLPSSRFGEGMFQQLDAGAAL